MPQATNAKTGNLDTSAERRIRVLLVAPSLDIVGGQAVQASRLLAALGSFPSVAVTFQPINPRLPGLLRKLQSIKYIRTIVTFVAYASMMLVRTAKADVLHVFTAASYSYLLWTVPALFFAKLYRKKIVLNYRDGRAEAHLSTWRIAVPTMRKMDAVVAPSGYLVDIFSKYGIPAEFIFNLIDTSQFRFRIRCRLRPIFLHNRMLEPLYNVPCTLRAFAIVQGRYPGAQLTIAHDGVCRASLEQLTRHLGLRNVAFIGEVSQARMAELYSEADIYVASPDLDCMPGSLLECFASGLPVVASAAGGVPYIAVHEETALLFPCNDHVAMAAAAVRLLEDDHLVERLTTNARAECKKYQPSQVAGQWVALYRRLTPVLR